MPGCVFLRRVIHRAADPAAVAESSVQLPDPDGKPADQTKPAKVFLLVG